VSSVPTKDLRAALLKTSVRTRISNGQPTYEDGLLGLVARQMKLARAHLDRFIACPLQADEYRQILLKGGHVTLPPVNTPDTPAQESRHPRRGYQKK
jgi:hypothetical protein